MTSTCAQWFAVVTASVLMPLLAAPAPDPGPAPTAPPVPPGPVRLTLAHDGSIAVLSNPAHGSHPGPSPAPVRIRFGLPSFPAERQAIPSLHGHALESRWTTNGIHYTQIALLTIWSPDGPSGSLGNSVPLLLVQIAGANRNSEYTEAEAAVGIDIAGRTLDLHLQDGRVTSPAGDSTLLALVEIEETGVAERRGPLLRFRANMPPGTSGAMTVKIPLAPAAATNALETLRDLAFDEEYRRLTRRPAAAPPTTHPLLPPLEFAN